MGALARYWNAQSSGKVRASWPVAPQVRSPVCGEVCLNTSAVVGAHFEDDGADGALMKWHYVGTADNGQNAEVFDAVFAKNNDATAAPTPTPGSDGAAGRSAGLLVALAAAAAAL